MNICLKQKIINLDFCNRMDLTLADLAELLEGVEIPVKPVAAVAEIPKVAAWEGAPLVRCMTTREKDIDAIGGMIAWSFADKKFRHFATHEDFIRYVLSLKPEQRTYCERIYHNQHQKLRLDIDCPVSDVYTITADDIDVIKAACCEVFQNMFGEYLLPEYVYVCDSSRADKQSFHLIIDRYYVDDHRIAGEFAERVVKILRPNVIADTIDMNIYKSATSLRAAYNHKNGVESAKRIPIGVNAIDTLITYVETCMPLKCHNSHIHVPRRVCKNAIKYSEMVVDAVPGHKFRAQCGGVLTFDRTKASRCHISGREHTHDNTLFAVISGSVLYAKCRHCPGSLRICDVPAEDVFAEAMPDADPANGDKKVTKPGIIENKLAREQRIRDLCSREYQHRKIGGSKEYEGKMNTYGDYMDEYPDPPTLHVKAAMGCGKTEALRRHIAKITPKSVLVISHRVSFTIDICAKLGYRSYQTIEGTISTKTAPFVVVQCESLHRVISERYEMVICDEIESIIAQMFAPTHRRANACWRVFESQVKFTDRLITMDGNLSQETIDVISMIREDRAEIVHNTVIPQISRHKITTNKEAAVAILMKMVEKGDRCVVPTSSIKTAKKLHKMIHGRFPDKAVRMYNSETSAEEREATLRDVNSSWRDCAVLIYTPTISAGISFTLHHFDSFVSFWYDSSCDVFTAMQMSRRARHISSGIYYHYVCETGHKLPDTADALVEYVCTSMKHASEYMEDPDGEIMPDGRLVFEDTPRFRAWLNIHVRRNYSRTHFLESLIRELKLIGGVVEPLITSFEGNTEIEKGVRAQLHAIGESIQDEDAAAVAAAPELTAAEIEGLSRGIVPCDNGRVAIAKYYLRRCYNYNGAITPAIARTYGDTTLKLQYHVRKNLREVHDEVFADPDSAVKTLGRRFCNVMIADFARADGSEVDNLRKLFDFNRDSLCVKMLGIFGLRLGDAKTLTRDQMLHALRSDGEGFQWLSANSKLICTTFGAKIAPLPNPKDPNYLRSMLDFINGKLKCRYGVSLKLTSHKSNMYRLEDTFAKLFTNTLEIPEPAK